MATTDGTDTPRRRSSRGRGRPPGNQPLVDRAAVIEAAFAAIKASGPAVTMEDIAKTADVTKPMVYRTIGDRDAVIVAVADELNRRVKTAADAERARGADRADQFHRVMEAIFVVLVEEREIYLFLDRVWSDVDREEQARIVRSGIGTFLPPMERLVDPDKAPPGLEETWSYATLGAIRGVVTMWLTRDYCPMDQVIDHIAAFLYRDGIQIGDAGPRAETVGD
ncbi:MAG: TetR/AcrR family transcriptional regulator [Actinomycetota bacterium]